MPEEQQKKDYEYTAISNLSPAPSANFYGRVVYYKPPTPTRGTDYVMNLMVVDDSIDNANVSDNINGLNVVIFKPSLEQFPDVRSEDEIVQFRHVRIQTFQNATQALSTNWSAFTVFYRNEHGSWQSRPPAFIDATEIETLNRISARTGHLAAVVRNSPKKVNPYSRPILTLDCLKPDIFFDLIAEVVRVLPSNTELCQQSLILTDYTANLMIKTNPSSFEMSPDYEHRLLLTTFWDNFATKAATLKEGQIVKIVNLRSKTISTPFLSDPASGDLVAVLHGDPSMAEKIFILSSTSPDVKIIQQRKAALLLENDHSAPVDIKADFNPSPKKANASPSKYQPLTAVLHNDVPFTAMGTVINTEECPAKFVIKGRVTKIHPPNTADFVRSFCPQHGNCPVSEDQTCTTCGMPCQLIFLFLLTVTDGFDNIKLIITRQDAVRFFNGLLPTTKNETVHDYISNAMQKLLTSPLPTSFCIKSFYVNNDERRYMVFDTILAIK